jgi:CRP-like cAMP-binding protein
MESTASLLRSRIFDSLGDGERSAWLAAASVSNLRRGQTLVRQGDPARCFYLVETGLVKIIQPTAKGRDVIVRFVGPGEPVGGVVALDGGTYPVTAVAVEATRLRAWPRDTLQPLLQRFPQVRTNIMREIASHMTDAMSRVRELTTERVGQRLARTIVRLMGQSGRRTRDGIVIEPALTRQELADLTGTTLYTVSRTLSQWEADGLVRSARRRLLVRSPQGLEALAHARED